MKVNRFPSTKLLTGVGLLCLLLAAVVIQGCSKGDVSADAPGGKGGKKGKGRGGDGGPVPVVAAKVSQKNVPIEVSAVGNVEAYSTINVIPQVGGQLTEAFFHEGDYVKKGEKLFSIDPRPLQAMVAQAEANLARIRRCSSRRKPIWRAIRPIRNTRTIRRYRYAKLFEQGIVSKDQGEQLATNADALSQSVQADKASIECSTLRRSSPIRRISRHKAATGLHDHLFAD